MARLLRVIILIFVLILLSSCSDEPSSENPDYETTKKMIVDILKTDDGMKAMEEIMADEEMQKHLVIQSDVVHDSINEVLTSEQGAEMWMNLFKDPNFVQNFAQSMEDPHEDLLKNLMNDAEFQEQMIDILQNPEINDQMLQLMKSQQFRTHLQETIQETLETPSFQAKMAEVLLKAAEEQQKQSGGDQSSDQSDKQSSEEGGEGQEGEEEPGSGEESNN